MHLGFKVKFGIFHLKSDSPAERRRKRAAKRKRRDGRRKRRQARQRRLRQGIERRAKARWNNRVREPVVASTRSRAERDDAKAKREAARRARTAERRAAARADAARVQREAGAPVKPRRAPTSPLAAPQNAHGQELPTGPSGWPGGVEAWVEQQNAEGVRSREQRQEQARAAGLCGAPTTKDRSPCLNHAGTCPHHSGARL